MSNPWFAFYFGDYIADTNHLTLAQHGAYLLLMGHYYHTGQPLPADRNELYRYCHCQTVNDKVNVDFVLDSFFVPDGTVCRHFRIDSELTRQAEYKSNLSKRGRAGAAKRWGGTSVEKNDACCIPLAMPKNANHNHISNSSQLVLTPVGVEGSREEGGLVHRKNGDAPVGFIRPTIEQVKNYCAERKNQVDAQQWFDHYSSNGWKVGRTAMKDWKAAVRTWERSEYRNGKAVRLDKTADFLRRHGVRVAN